MSSEPAPKKAKTTVENVTPAKVEEYVTPAKAAVEVPSGWENHTLNISEALMKKDEGRHLTDVSDDDIITLQGIGSMSSNVLKSLGVKTIRQLATYKYFLLSRALKTLAETETRDDRPVKSVMNIDKAVIKEWESKSLTDICNAPTESLEGITTDACELLETLGIKTISDMAEFKYCRWAEAIVQASQYEELNTSKERKLNSALKRLA